MIGLVVASLAFCAAGDPYDYKDLVVEPVVPVSVSTGMSSTVLHDFGRDAVGWLEIESPTGGAFDVTLGELVDSDGVVTNPYPEAWITCERVKGVAIAGTFRVALPKKKLNTSGWDPRAPSVLLPDRLGVVAPFRYVAARKLPRGATLRRMSVSYPMDLTQGSFESENGDLDRLYDFCRYSMKATSFCGMYVDGDRERTPYEADAYLNQLSQYAVDGDYSLARKTHEYLLSHPTWPTEWKQFSIMMAWTDWMWSGDTRSIAKFYGVLKNEKLNPGLEVRSDGLLVTCWETRGGPTMSRDIIDWPACERDGFVMNTVNAVVNAFRYRNLRQMAEIARALGKTADAADFERQADRVFDTYNRVFFDARTGLYVDGENIAHASLHANAAALAMGLVPDARVSRVADFLEAKGMACSTYFAQFLLEALYAAGRDEAAMKLMLNPGPRGWLQMMDRFGSTVSLESWDFEVKPNQDLNHAWGAVPLNIMARYVLGVEPTKPGFAEYRVNPRPSGLKTFRGTVPTPRGPVTVEYRNGRRVTHPWLSLKDMLRSPDREALLATSCEIDRWCDGEGVITNPPRWMTAGFDECDRTNRTSAAVSLAYADALERMGRAFGLGGFPSRARQLRQTVARRFGVWPPAGDDEYLHEIRPGGVNGQAFWNGRATLFMYPPAFDFRPAAGASRYRFRVLDDALELHEFEAERPTASLRPVWAELGPGFVRVECHALTETGELGPLVGERRFWKQAPFEAGTYPAARRSYREARRKICAYLLATPEARRMAAVGAPDLADGSNFTSYPSKMQSAMIHAMIAAADLLPERRDEALKIARACGDYLLLRRQPAGRPLEFFTPTYEGKDQLSGTYGGQNMLLYPAAAGTAWLALAKATGDARYRDAALAVAETYLKLQGADGTWFLKMWEQTGAPVTPNRIVPIGIIRFLEQVYAETGDGRYRAAADRAFAFIEDGPLKDWNWEGQFEDIAPAKTKYFNLTKHNACETAIYLLRRFPGDARRLAQAREILRFAEDQFVCWRTPARADGVGIDPRPRYPYRVWVTPAVLEQYNCYSPIDASAAKLIMTYLALYRAEGRPADLAKARALGDALTNNQYPDGRVRTYFVPAPDDPEGRTFRQPAGGDWYNCMQADAEALELLE